MSKKENLPKATHLGEVDLNGFIISCAVLEDGRRIFSERSLAGAFGIKGSGAYWQKKKGSKDGSAILPEYLSAKYLQPFISNELTEKLSSAISYITLTGTIAKGIDATVLADICDVYVTAKNNGVNNENFLKVADNAYAMIKAFAKVGIIALIDEATGYQYNREKDALQEILKLYVSEDILNWQKTFHDSFYKEIFRLRDWPFTEKGINSRPGVVGTYTNTFIYDQMPPGVMEKIREITPKNKKGHYVYKFHQSLTPDIGRDHLKNQLVAITTLMSVSRSWKEFLELFNRKYRDFGEQLAFDFGDNDPIPPKPKPSNQFDQQLKGLLAVPPPKKEKK